MKTEELEGKMAEYLERKVKEDGGGKAGSDDGGIPQVTVKLANIYLTPEKPAEASMLADGELSHCVRTCTSI